MHPEDERFLRLLGVFPARPEDGLKWRLLSRRGRALLLLSDEVKDFGEGLSLYIPLRLGARILTGCLARFPSLRILLPRHAVEFGNQSPLSEILKSSGTKPVTILLGNPEQHDRRAVVLVRNALGQTNVIKLGSSKAAASNVTSEAERLTELAEKVPGAVAIPALLRSWIHQDWAAFQLPHYRITQLGETTPKKVTEILISWVMADRTDRLRTLPSWQEIEPLLEPEEIEEAGQLMLAPSLRHGDFAPWNLMEDDSGELVVIDWESASYADVPGWDFVHFQMMDQFLVQRDQPKAAIEKTQAVLRENAAVGAYLEKVGWKGHEELLTKSYLLMMRKQLPEFQF